MNHAWSGGQAVPAIPRADEGSGGVVRGGGRSRRLAGVHEAGTARHVAALPVPAGRAGSAGACAQEGHGGEGRRRRRAWCGGGGCGGRHQGRHAEAQGAGPVPAAAAGVPAPRHHRELPVAAPARPAGARRRRAPCLALRALPPPVRRRPSDPSPHSSL